MPTANVITDHAYRLCGILTPTSAQDANALISLNAMIALWSTKGLMIHTITEETHTLVVGTEKYTIGASATIATVRPTEFVSAYLIDADGIDFPVDVNMTLDEYNRIADKTVQARPTRLYYATELTDGEIHFNYAPDYAYTFTYFTKKPFTAHALISTTVALPAEYEKVLAFSLAVDMAPELNVVLDPSVPAMAGAGQFEIQNLNSGPLGGARMDPAIVASVQR